MDHSGRTDGARDADAEQAEGLGKFDLGMVPASVTPPRSWRRAAWFAVAAATAASGGLVLAASVLLGYSRPPRAVDLPDQPAQEDDPPWTATTASRVPRAMPSRPQPTDAGVTERVGRPAPLTVVGGVVPIPGAAPAEPDSTAVSRPLPLPDPPSTQTPRQRCDRYLIPFAPVRVSMVGVACQGPWLPVGPVADLLISAEDMVPGLHPLEGYSGPIG